MKTPEEVAARYKEVKPKDYFGFLAEVYLWHLPFELAKAWLKDDAKVEDWIQLPLDRESVLEALAARHCYATTGSRMLVQITLVDGDGQRVLW